jgi:hypothetical protein
VGTRAGRWVLPSEKVIDAHAGKPGDPEGHAGAHGVSAVDHVAKRRGRASKLSSVATLAQQSRAVDMEIRWAYDGAMVVKRRKQKDERKDDSIRLRLTTEEKAAFTAAAKKDNRDLSNWLRTIARREAGLAT